MIWNSKFLLHGVILEILDIVFYFVLRWDPGACGSKIFALPWYPRNAGILICDSDVKSRGSWILVSAVAHV